MKRFFILIAVCISFLLSACGDVCPEGCIQYINDSSIDTSSDTTLHTSMPQEVEIRTGFGSKIVSVDKIVHGSLCNDTWSGTVYVACDIEIPEWEGNPTFLRDCDLIIEPGTTVYVAAHNDTMYTQGCSCHE